MNEEKLEQEILEKYKDDFKILRTSKSTTEIIKTVNKLLKSVNLIV